MLVVDDDLPSLAHCRDLLRQHVGYDAIVVGAESTAEAARLVDAAPPDILLVFDGCGGEPAPGLLVEKARALRPDGCHELVRRPRAHGEMTELVRDVLARHGRGRR